jgi:hypothetical protein
MPRFLVASCLVFVLISPCLATTYVVKPDGTGDFPTIAAAIQAAVTGDVIELTDGTFMGPGNCQLRYQGKAITIRSQSGDPATCRIDCAGTWGIRFDQGEGSGAILQGVGLMNAPATYRALEVADASPTITGCRFESCDGAVCCDSGADPVIQDCLFTACATAIYLDFDSEAEILGCWFTGITVSALTVTYGAGASLETCTFEGNTTTSTDLVTCSAGGGRLTSCTFARNSVPADKAIIFAVGEYMAPASVRLYNTIIAFTGDGGAARSSGSTTYWTLECCDVFANAGGDYVGPLGGFSGVDGNLSADPLFCGPHDYTLNLGSPCAPEANPVCGLVGAWPVQCDDVYEFACCTGAACQVLTLPGCNALGGTWLIGQPSCDPNPCAAACCLGGECQVLGADECAAAGGEWLQGQPTCNFNPCDSTYVVLADGSGEYATIREAMDAAFDGYTVLLEDGIFIGEYNREISFHGRAITLASKHGDPTTCVIDCGGAGVGLRLENSEPQAATVSGITVRHANPDAVYCSESNATFVNCVFSLSYRGARVDEFARGSFSQCTFTDNQQFGAYNYYHMGNGADFEDCVFANNGTSGVCGCDVANTFTRCVFLNNGDTGRQGGFYGSYWYHPTLTNCLFFGNVANQGGGLYLGYECTLHMANCTFYGNSAPEGSGIYLDYVSPSPDVARTIIAAGLGGAAVACPLISPTFGCSDIYGNEGGDWVGPIAGQLGLNGNISLDPLLCNPPGMDFHLQEESPCAPYSPQNPGCPLVGAYPVGCNLSAVGDAAQEAHGLSLACTNPNPLGPETRITYAIPAADGAVPVSLCVYDIAGRQVRLLVDGKHAGGPGEVVWDGTDDDGAQLPGGVYFCRLTSGARHMSQRIVLLR